MDNVIKFTKKNETSNDGVICENPRHGSPQDRGSADAYYGRPFNPHYYVGGTGTSERVKYEDMTENEIKAYVHGYMNEENRKEW